MHLLKEAEGSTSIPNTRPTTTSTRTTSIFFLAKNDNEVLKRSFSSGGNYLNRTIFGNNKKKKMKLDYEGKKMIFSFLQMEANCDLSSVNYT